MSKFISRLSIAALLALGTTVGAQEAEAPAEPAQDTEQTEQETGNALTQGLDTGREVQEDGSYIREAFDDWQLKCFRNQTEDTPEMCQMYQLLTESEGNPVAEFSLYKLANAGNVVAGATIAVPLGTLLSEEVKLSVDDGKAKSYAYSFCTMGGCFARIGLTQPEVDALKRGVKATIQIVPAQAPDQTVRIDASLAGFTAAYDAASELSN